MSNCSSCSIPAGIRWFVSGTGDPGHAEDLAAGAGEVLATLVEDHRLAGKLPEATMANLSVSRWRRKRFTEVELAEHDRATPEAAQARLSTTRSGESCGHLRRHECARWWCCVS